MQPMFMILFKFLQEEVGAYVFSIHFHDLIYIFPFFLFIVSRDVSRVTGAKLIRPENHFSIFRSPMSANYGSGLLQMSVWVYNMFGIMVQVCK